MGSCWKKREKYTYVRHEHKKTKGAQPTQPLSMPLCNDPEGSLHERFVVSRPCASCNNVTVTVNQRSRGVEYCLEEMRVCPRLRSVDREAVGQWVSCWYNHHSDRHRVLSYERAVEGARPRDKRRCEKTGSGRSDMSSACSIRAKL